MATITSKLFCAANPTASGRAQDLEAWKITLTPSTAVDWPSDTPTSLTLDGEILGDAKQPSYQITERYRFSSLPPCNGPGSEEARASFLDVKFGSAGSGGVRNRIFIEAGLVSLVTSVNVSLRNVVTAPGATEPEDEVWRLVRGRVCSRRYRRRGGGDGILNWPLRETLVAFLNLLKEKADAPHSLNMQLWAAMTAFSGGVKPPEMPDLLK